jgi:cell division protein FtsQ
MRDLHAKKQRQVPHNRVKKTPKKRKPVNWRPILTWLSRGIGGAAICGALGFGGLQLYRLVSRTTLLRLETIEVSPLKKLTRSEVVALSGVKPGDSMLGLKLKNVVAQLSKNPWIEQVQVRRFFPHTLSITLSERTPQAVANVGCLYYLDGKGMLFKSLVDGDRLDYPLITGVNEEDLEKDPAGSKEALKNALQLIASLRASSVFGLEDVSEIHYDKGYGFTLFTMQGGVPVKLGNDGFSEKLARLGGIYPGLKAQMHALDYIDLDYGDKIIVKKV